MSVVSLLKNPALGNEEPLKIFEQRGNIHSLKHLHSDFYVPGAVLDTRDAVLNWTKSCPQEANPRETNHE